MSAADLRRTRFAYSPLAEVAESLRMIASGRIHFLHRAWFATVREDLHRVDMRVGCNFRGAAVIRQDAGLQDRRRGGAPARLLDRSASSRPPCPNRTCRFSPSTGGSGQAPKTKIPGVVPVGSNKDKEAISVKRGIVKGDGTRKKPPARCVIRT
jgi:hypothetical protein